VRLSFSDAVTPTQIQAVTPAKAGVQLRRRQERWIPIFAGVTRLRVDIRAHRPK
jgi:hypothetical protein